MQFAPRWQFPPGVRQLATVGALLSSVLIPTLARAASPITGAMVRRAIRGGVSYLLQQEQPNTFWERGATGSGPVGTFSEKGGETALVVQALLDVGQSLKLKRLSIFGPQLKPAIAYLANLKPTGTYAASYQANAITLLPRKSKFRMALRWDGLYFLRAVHRDGAYSYAYFANAARDKVFAAPTAWDNSNSQYGVLGAWACIHGLRGEWPLAYWRLVARHWRQTQFPDGSWGYWGFSGELPARQPSLWRKTSMTPAGVASLLIADEYLAPPSDAAVLRGLNWMNQNFDPNLNNEYAMYGYERVGLASGLTRFGGHDWYRTWARTLLNSQANDGSWGGGFWAADPISGTAYALLILDRGLNPIFISKLDYGKQYFGRWNHYHRDLANLTSWVSDTTESPVNWQVAGLHSGIQNWLNAPILYISGRQDPKFSKADLALLRRYIAHGGTVLCSCDQASTSFRLAMLKYGAAVMKHQYEFARLTPANMLFHIQPWYRNFFMNMYALSNGVRYVWLVAPEDFSSIWQRHAFADRQPWQFALNLYLYCTGKRIESSRLHSMYVAAPPPGGDTHVVRVVQLSYSGNWQPEPGAWPRFSRIMGRKYNTNLQINTAASVPARPAGPDLLYLTGTDKCDLTSAQIQSVRALLQSGGTLFADAAGGSRPFTDSFNQLVAKLFPGEMLQPIKPTSALFSGEFAGATKIARVHLRKFAIASQGGHKKPHLEGIKIGRRWAIIFSPDDIASGLLGTHTWGITGYTPQSSLDLARNIVAYAAAPKK